MNNISLEELIIKVEMKLSEFPEDLKDIVTSLKRLKEGRLVDMQTLQKLVIWVYCED